MPDVCIAGAANGLLLWWNTVLPTLFPFFIVTRIILKCNIFPAKLIKLFPVLTGMIAGYPTGAVTITELLNTKVLSKKEADTILVLSNNASPGFLIGYTSLCHAPLKNTPYIIWCTVMLSSLIVSIPGIIRLISTPKSDTVIHRNNDERPVFTINFFEDTMLECFRILVMIGGYIMIFSMFANIMSSLFDNNQFLSLATGTLEVTTGVHLISDAQIFSSTKIQSALIAALCSFGGFSAYFQTAGFLKNSGLSTLHYLSKKITGGFISFFLYYIIS